MANTTRDAFITMSPVPPVPAPVIPPVHKFKAELDALLDTLKNDNPVFWEAETRRLYWIEWEDTGNNEIPHKHYIATIN